MRELQSSIPALFTDLYELTMAAAYWDNNIDSIATFDLFFRNLPPKRNYMIAAGIHRAIQYILDLKFDRREIDYLRNLDVFRDVSPIFFEYLSQLRFSGSVRAVPEGTFVFPTEPVLTVTAPIIEAQLIETALLSVINFETMVASKAARIARAAGNRPVVEFGARRAHGPAAAVNGARAAIIGGLVGTSNLEAGLTYDIPVYGTVAHSFIMAHDDELTAFENFARTFPGNVILLIDTYDTLEGARLATKLGQKVKGVRLDSGDMYDLSVQVRKILDDAGLNETKIMASGDLNESKIQDLVKSRAPIDSFGVGSELITSKDSPTMPGVYKLVETRNGDDIDYRIKLSEDKSTIPGQKEVYRMRGEDGLFVRDIIAARGEFESEAHGASLLKTFIEDGELVGEFPTLEWIQNRVKKGITGFKDEIHDIVDQNNYPVELSPKIEEYIKIAKQGH